MDTVQRAHACWKQLLEDYQQPFLDPAIEEELTTYIENRRQAIQQELST